MISQVDLIPLSAQILWLAQRQSIRRQRSLLWLRFRRGSCCRYAICRAGKKHGFGRCRAECRQPARLEGPPRSPGLNSGSRLIGGGKPLLEPPRPDAAQDIANKKAAQIGAAFLSQWRLSRRGGVLRIADRVVGGALRLVHLALGLHFLVTRHLPAVSLTAPLTLSAAPLMCSRSMIRSSRSHVVSNAKPPSVVPTGCSAGRTAEFVTGMSDVPGDVPGHRAGTRRPSGPDFGAGSRIEYPVTSRFRASVPRRGPIPRPAVTFSYFVRAVRHVLRGLDVLGPQLRRTEFEINLANRSVLGFLFRLVLGIRG